MANEYLPMIMTSSGIAIVAIAMYYLIKIVVEDEDVNKITKKMLFVVLFLDILYVVITGMTMGYSNHGSRNDVDRTEIFNQMNQLQK